MSPKGTSPEVSSTIHHLFFNFLKSAIVPNTKYPKTAKYTMLFKGLLVMRHVPLAQPTSLQ